MGGDRAEINDIARSHGSSVEPQGRRPEAPEAPPRALTVESVIWGGQCQALMPGGPSGVAPTLAHIGAFFRLNAHSRARWGLGGADAHRSSLPAPRRLSGALGLPWV